MARPPIAFNIATWAILPILIIKAKTFEEQIDIIYQASDDPDTSPGVAADLANLAGTLLWRARNSIIK